jgi:DNA repair protein NreA
MAIPEEIKRNKYRLLALENIKNKAFVGSTPPGLFVGEYNYPKVNVSVVSPTQIVDNAAYMDTPEQWYGLPLNDFIIMRQQLIHASKKFETGSAKDPSTQLQNMQELLMSKSSLAIDVQLEKQPTPRLSFDERAAPTGPGASMKKFSLEDTPRFEKRIQSAHYDTDLKAQEAVLGLYEKGHTVSSLYKLLSAGTFGIEKNRKLVPTKWSITAVDDMTSKYLMEQIKNFPLLETYELFESHYLDNHFYILLMPSVWGFEMMESWLKIIHGLEKIQGRTKYADNITGAYYSARLAACEYLETTKKQASVLVLREIGAGYEVPLGTWQIREGCRQSFNFPKHTFHTLKSALEYLRFKLVNPILRYKQKSVLIDDLQHQTRISTWF